MQPAARALPPWIAIPALVAASACGLWLAVPRASHGTPPDLAEVSLISPTEKVLRWGPPPGADTHAGEDGSNRASNARWGEARPASPVEGGRARPPLLDAARGGTVVLQAVVTALAEPVRGLQAEVEVAPPLAARLYREAFVHLDVPSNVEGSAGDYPDPLIPTVDRFDRQPRAALPVDVPAGARQPLWIEIEVPEAAPPGRYDGTIRLWAAGLAPVELPFSVRVRAFVVPRTATLPTIFGWSAISAMRAHYGRYTSDEDGIHLYHRYAALALLDRITLGGGLMAPPDYRVDPRHGTVSIDWARYDREVGPLLDGTLPEAPGARSTTVGVRWPSPERVPPAALPSYLDAWRAHFTEKGWLPRLYDYTWDEPKPSDFAALHAQAALVARALPEIPRLATVSVLPALADAITLFTPLVNCVDPKPGGDFEPPDCGPAALARQRARGERVFWYQSCESHGCDIVGSGYFTGWPSYVVDAPPLAARVMGWLAFRFGLDGELYYNTVEAYNDGDPWVSLRRHGGNGDGTLFYPGTPARVGGTTDIPIGSLRLAYIRAGLQDYEWLALAKRLGGRAAEVARVAAERVAAHAFAWDHDPRDFDEARAQVGDAIEAQLTTGGR